MNDREIRQELLQEIESIRVSPGLTACTIAQMEGETVVKKNFARSFALAMCLILAFAGAALAAAGGAGLFDFMNRSDNTGLPENAEEYIQENVAAAESEDGRFCVNVREAAFDGMTLYAVVDVTHKDGTAFFVHASSSASDPAGDLSMGEGAYEGSILDLWYNSGAGQMYQVNLLLSGEENGIARRASMDGIRQQDGVYTLYIVTELEQAAEDKEFRFVLTLLPFADPEQDDRVDYDARIEIPLQFSLQAEEIAEMVVAFPGTEIHACGVRLDRVELTRAAFETYVRVTYTVTDAAAFAATDGGLVFRAVDGNGTVLPSGVRGYGYTELVSGADGEAGATYEQFDTLYFPGIPEELILQAFNCWDKGEYETVTVTLGGTESTAAE